jgi:hypothetical protein
MRKYDDGSLKVLKDEDASGSRSQKLACTCEQWQ